MSVDKGTPVDKSTSIESLITDHIDIWTSAIKRKSATGRGSNKKRELYGINKLRELILELAVRGKLIPQDPNDEPASVLLERIAEEKAQLVKDKKIKKPKKLPEITEDEKPFELPEGWEWARFQDISEYIQRGKGPKYSDIGDVRVVSQKCVQLTGFDLTPCRYIENSSLEAYQSERFLKNNDLLWNSTGTGTVGRINIIENIEPRTLVADSHVTVIRTIFVNTGFIWSYVSAPGIQSRIEPIHENALVSGSTKQVELNTSSVINLLIPIPSKAEQQRIVAKVDELMALCDELEAQTESSLDAHQTLVTVLLDTLVNSQDADELAENWTRLSDHFDTLFTTEHSIDQLKQSVLQLAVMGKLVPQDPNDEPASVLLERIAVEKEQLIKDKKIKKQKPLPPITDDEKPFKLPKGWELRRLGDLAYVFAGNSFKSGDFNNAGGTRVIKITNTGVGKIIETEEFLPKSFSSEYKNYQVIKGDLIMALTRPYISNGLKVSLCPDSYNNALINQRVAAIRSFTDTSFLYQFMQSNFVLGLYRNRFGNSGLQPNLKMNDVTDLLIPVPPKHEQHRIVTKVDELMALCDQLKTRLNDAQTTQRQLADALTEQAL